MRQNGEQPKIQTTDNVTVAIRLLSNSILMLTLIWVTLTMKMSMLSIQQLNGVDGMLSASHCRWFLIRMLVIT